LFGVVIVDLIGFGIVVPVLPFLAKQLGAGATALGVLVAAYSAAQFAMAPLWGRLSDRIGRRRVMLITVAGTALSLLALGLSHSLVAMLAARLLGGAFAGNLGVAAAYIADVTTEQERTRWMGLLGASFGVGFVLGPAIGGALAPFGYSVPMLAAAGLAALNWLQAALRLREPPEHARADEARPASRFAALRDPLVRLLCLAWLAFSLAVTQLETIFAYFMMDRFGYDAHQVAFILVGMAIVMGAIQGGGMRLLASHFGERALVIAGSLGLAACFAIVPAVHSIGLLIAVLTGCAVSRAVVQPPLMSMASLAATAASRGAVMGTFQSSGSLARAIGPLLAGALYELALPLPFVLGSALLLAVALLGRALPEREADTGSLGEAGAAG
jgi:MFS transporter, DHA1 family, tetracycline resistance protein